MLAFHRIGDRQDITYSSAIADEQALGLITSRKIVAFQPFSEETRLVRRMVKLRWRAYSTIEQLTDFLADYLRVFRKTP